MISIKKPVLPLVRSVQVTYCDDVRRESSGKLIFVGAYGESLNVDEFPTTVRTLYVISKIITPSNKPFTELCVIVFANREEIRRIKVAQDDMKELHSISSSAEEDSALIINIGLELNDIEITEPGWISVEVESESEIIKALPLHIVLQE
jgi:hypothetical protein